MNKRVRDLRDDLKKRRWGGMAAPSSKERQNGTGSNDVPMGRRGEGEERKERKGKRLGKKERMKMKVVEEGDGAAFPVLTYGTAKPFKGVSHSSQKGLEVTTNGGDQAGTGDETERKKRKKKKKTDKGRDGRLMILD